MICALTVRTLKPGTFEQFREEFMKGASPENLPEQWVRFNMIRSLENPDEVICFGLFDGTVEDLKSDAAGEAEYRAQLDRVAPFVASVGTDGFFDVVENQVREAQPH